MKCCHCEKWKERTTEYFTAAGVNGDIEKWFRGSIPGYEPIGNNQTVPCNRCFKKLDWIRGIVHKYPKLRPPENLGYPDSPVGWFHHSWDNFVSCPITGLPKSFFKLGPNRKNGIGINNQIINIFEGRKYSQKTHRSETTELCANFANVQQGEKIPILNWSSFYENLVDLIENDIDLQIEEDTMIKIINKNWENAPYENGVTTLPKENPILYRKEVYELHLRRIISIFANRHVESDIKAERIESSNIKEVKSSLRKYYFELLVKQGFRCATSLMMMTIENGPRRFSFDRINDKLGHIPGNVRAVCRIFNPGNGCHMSLNLFMQAFLEQTIIPIPKTS
jgi:hypothetical protein